MANANLLARFAQPVRSVQDFQDDYMRQDIAKQGMQRNALLLQEGQAVQQDRERTRMDGETLRNALAALPPGATHEQRIGAMEATNLPAGYSQADALRKSLAEQRKSAAAASKDEAEAAAKQYAQTRLKLEHGIQGLQVAQAPQQAIGMFVDGVRLGYWDENTAKQGIQGIPQDQAQFMQWRQQQLAQILDASKQLPTIQTRNTGGSTDTLAIDPLTGIPRVTGSVRNTQSPESVASNATQMRGQNMTDARARDFNAVQVEGNNIKRAEVTQGKDLTKNSQLASFDTMLGTLERLATHKGLARSVGIPGALPTMPGSESANFQAELNTFQSQAFLPMVAQLKGMGALSDAEGKKLTAAVGALDPKMGEKAFRESIGRITTEMMSARDRVAGTGGAPKPAPKPTAKAVKRTGTSNGRKVVEYVDGSIEYAD